MRLFFAAALALLTIAPAHAEPARMFLLDECSWQQPFAACLEMPLYYGNQRKPPNAIEATQLVAPSSYRPWTIMTQASLADGTEQTVELLVWTTRDLDYDFLLQAAYLGQSPEGRTIVMSDHGPLTLLDPAFTVGREAQVFVIDEKAKRLHRSFLAPPYVTFVMRTPDWISVLREREQWVQAPWCLPAPELKPGLLSFDHLECTSPTRTTPPEIQFSEAIAGDIARAPNADLDLIRKLTGAERGDVSDEALRRRTGRITGTNYLVVTPWSPDDC